MTLGYPIDPKEKIIKIEITKSDSLGMPSELATTRKITYEITDDPSNMITGFEIQWKCNYPKMPTIKSVTFLRDHWKYGKDFPFYTSEVGSIVKEIKILETKKNDTSTNRNYYIDRN
jgi:hypothetical protein